MLPPLWGVLVKRVFIESPFAGDVARNVAYLRACLADSLARGEAPYASHAIYTQPGVLRDEIPQEREAGLAAGDVWRRASELIAVYTDLGVSGGMLSGIDRAYALGLPVEERVLGAAWEAYPPPRMGGVLYAPFPLWAGEPPR